MRRGWIHAARNTIDDFAPHLLFGIKSTILLRTCRSGRVELEIPINHSANRTNFASKSQKRLCSWQNRTVQRGSALNSSISLLFGDFTIFHLRIIRFSLLIVRFSLQKYVRSRWGHNRRYCSAHAARDKVDDIAPHMHSGRVELEIPINHSANRTNFASKSQNRRCSWQNRTVQRGSALNSSISLLFGDFTIFHLRII
ncbi:hypothetical protein PAESOLCIP111_03404 [Paenibacillus solanacearum]|uniref:Uncharacterized protein n=1 Tax=Paenibacillus solanacearum TaxID=2048548 RepID=A0A916NJC2_9BACL|nr:hypothetical protein PAESOLCIP111_03404 [Paenibacillus solanacearum]